MTQAQAKVTMTLNQIKGHRPCTQGWTKLLKGLGKTAGDDTPVSLAFILENNGIHDAIWCMRVNWFQHKELYMEFIKQCVERAEKYAVDAAADAAADACAAADAADAADAAAAYAGAAADAAAACAYAAERTLQYNHLMELLTK